MPGSSGRVLVVDDNKVIRQLIRVNLELEGFEVVTAADGAECLEIVHRVRPDVITLDVVMPRLDGKRTAARLHADPYTRQIPVAIVSACTQQEFGSGPAPGVDAFLSKPFEPVELVRLVRRLAGCGGRSAGPATSAASGRGGLPAVGGDPVAGSEHVDRGSEPDPQHDHPMVDCGPEAVGSGAESVGGESVVRPTAG